MNRRFPVMSVLKSKRKPSQFEVFHHYYKMRKEITDLLLRDFGFSQEKAERKLKRQFSEEMTDDEKERYQKLVERDRAFDEWFITDERNTIMGYLRNLGMYVFSANNIYPQSQDELTQRRLYQERALGCCEMLSQELQYTIETLPVDVNKFTRFSDMIEEEIKLIKAWRKSDNKFKKLF